MPNTERERHATERERRETGGEIRDAGHGTRNTDYGLQNTSHFTDPTYLRTQQYRDATNLNARIALHRRFSTNRHPWPRWVFDQLRLPPRCTLLELGCGPGDLWAENHERIPQGWEITLSDLSPGMVREARARLDALSHPFAFAILDAQSIPIPSQRFDAVLANHMLYHVPDRARTLAEIRRVLKPGGRLFATTVGITHLRELREWTDWFNLEGARETLDPANFWLETASRQLSPWFAEIRMTRRYDALAVTEIAPIIDYIGSSASMQLDAEGLASLRSFLEEQLATASTIHITKDTCMFEAMRK
jgi:ubiquinone/menaquinone biosynthesis C-methylase UbiE